MRSRSRAIITVIVDGHRICVDVEGGGTVHTWLGVMLATARDKRLVAGASVARATVACRLARSTATPATDDFEAVLAGTLVLELTTSDARAS